VTAHTKVFQVIEGRNIPDILYTDILPIPKKEEVVSHPERACAAGSTLHVISEREELSL
jgi:hypothetical protein